MRPIQRRRRGASLIVGLLLAPLARAEQGSEPFAASGEPGGLEETPERLPSSLSRRADGIEAALRASYGVPFGSSTEDTNIRDLIVGVIPVQFDLGYRFDEHWFAGVFGAAGIGVKGEQCREDGQPPTAPTDGTEETPTFGVKCDAPNAFRIGVQVHLALLPTTDDVSPWVGAGVGYEWLNISETLGRRTFVQNFSGLEFLNLQAGVDFALGSRLRLGPFAQFSVARYTSITADASADAEPLPTPDRALHQWLNLGIKVSIGPFGT